MAIMSKHLDWHWSRGWILVVVLFVLSSLDCDAIVLSSPSSSSFLNLILFLLFLIYKQTDSFLNF